MRRVVLVAALWGSGCWTGTAAPPPIQTTTAAAPRPHTSLQLHVRLERTSCLGPCPAYTVTIDGDGRVGWNGKLDVAATGRRQGRVSRRELDRLARWIERARFFERDPYGGLPIRPTCTTVGSTTTCSLGTSVSICTDTPHAIITVERDGRRHTVDDDGCERRRELEGLEQYIDKIANTAEWIGS